MIRWWKLGMADRLSAVRTGMGVRRKGNNRMAEKLGDTEKTRRMGGMAGRNNMVTPWMGG